MAIQPDRLLFLHKQIYPLSLINPMMNSVLGNADLRLPANGVQTFVIFDLETTGLDTNLAQITEIALIAVTRDDFLSSVRNNCVFPRITNKICMAVKPTIPIHPKAAEVSGLTNDLLLNQQNFPSAYEVISPFLSRLPTPICLIAHNGRRFDIPLLKNELARYDLTLNQDIWFLDTLIVLPELDKKWITPATSSKRVPQVESPRDAPAHSTVEESSRVQGYIVPNESFTPIYQYTINYGNRVDSWKSPTKASSPGSNQHDPVFNGEIVNGVNSLESRPNGQNINGAGSSTDDGTRELLVNEMTNIRELSNKVNVCLAQAIISQSPKLPTTYKQPAIYKRLFNNEPKAAHTAEGDCQTLLEIVLLYGETFVDAADRCAAKMYA